MYDALAKRSLIYMCHQSSPDACFFMAAALVFLSDVKLIGIIYHRLFGPRIERRSFTAINQSWGRTVFLKSLCAFRSAVVRRDAFLPPNLAWLRLSAAAKIYLLSFRSFTKLFVSVTTDCNTRIVESFL